MSSSDTVPTFSQSLVLCSMTADSSFLPLSSSIQGGPAEVSISPLWATFSKYRRASLESFSASLRKDPGFVIEYGTPLKDVLVAYSSYVEKNENTSERWIPLTEVQLPCHVFEGHSLEEGNIHLQGETDDRILLTHRTGEDWIMPDLVRLNFNADTRAVTIDLIAVEAVASLEELRIGLLALTKDIFTTVVEECASSFSCCVNCLSIREEEPTLASWSSTRHREDTVSLEKLQSCYTTLLQNLTRFTNFVRESQSLITAVLQAKEPESTVVLADSTLERLVHWKLFRSIVPPCDCVVTLPTPLTPTSFLSAVVFTEKVRACVQKVSLITLPFLVVCFNNPKGTYVYHYDEEAATLLAKAIHFLKGKVFVYDAQQKADLVKELPSAASLGWEVETEVAENCFPLETFLYANSDAIPNDAVFDPNNVLVRQLQGNPVCPSSQASLLDGKQVERLPFNFIPFVLGKILERDVEYMERLSSYLLEGGRRATDKYVKTSST
ncbi:hypothetical protein AGDE_14944 [Angomonas deanei]|nr:hypothetical protein AGDE_14944 [Angomonas deanei]|eukprot:EPY19945.1 hypothetical protein AGDE_14944 [Angomonas deanei]